MVTGISWESLLVSEVSILTARLFSKRTVVLCWQPSAKTLTVVYYQLGVNLLTTVGDLLCLRGRL